MTYKIQLENFEGPLDLLLYFIRRDELDIYDIPIAKITKDWLSNNNIDYDAFYMRKDDDNRKDALVKKEMYVKYLSKNFNIEFILDDRDQVVDMWRNELNLKCFQVNYGDF